MSANQDWDAAADALRSDFPEHLREILLASLTKDDHLYDGERLRVGADLKPVGEGCDRATWYRLHGAEADPPQIARRLRYERGRMGQKMFAQALRESGHEIVEEVACRPLRPSAWAWDGGHGDVLDVTARHLYEVKVPGVDAWRRARGLPKKLVRAAYMFQLSFYFHELARHGKASTASWIFLDLEGEFDPVEIKLEGDLLVPLDEIVRLEESKNHLLTDAAPPPRPTDTLEIVKVLKGGRRTKKNPNPQREVVAVRRRYWACSYCDLVGVCQPGPEETPVELAADDPVRVRAVADAEAAWAREDADKRSRKNAEVYENGVDEALKSAEVYGPPQETKSQEAPPSQSVNEFPHKSLNDGNPPAAGPPPPPAKILEAPAARPLPTDEARRVVEEAGKIVADLQARDDEAARRSLLGEVRDGW